MEIVKAVNCDCKKSKNLEKRLMVWGTRAKYGVGMAMTEVYLSLSSHLAKGGNPSQFFHLSLYTIIFVEIVT